MQKHSIQILDVRQAAFYVAHKMRLRCRCRCILMLFLAYPVEPTGRGASHSKYFGKREHQFGEDDVYEDDDEKGFYYIKIFNTI